METFRCCACGKVILALYRFMWGGLWQYACDGRCQDDYIAVQHRRAERAGGIVPRHLGHGG